MPVGIWNLLIVDQEKIILLSGILFGPPGYSTGQLNGTGITEKQVLLIMEFRSWFMVKK